MKRKIVIGIFLMIWIATPALGAELFVYPTKGQSQEQTEQDKSTCYRWAKAQTGFDPMAVPTATAPPPSQQKSTTGAVGGAVAGAATGAIIGGAAKGEAGKGAAIGAITGGLIGGMRRRKEASRNQQQQEQWAQQQAAQYHHKRNEYNRAYAACLEAKGYTVK